MSALAAASSLAGGRTRIWGWDILRGLSALAVALYHLMLWLDLASLYTLGSYGVYLFFVLSGASLAYTYGDRLNGVRPVLAFLATRWLRLAPLFMLVTLVFVVFYSTRAGTLVPDLGWRLGLNATFAFGLNDPVIWSIPIGGWSLGIEFVYYLLFPMLMLAVRGSGIRWAALLASGALQWYWIQTTAGSPAGYVASAVAYHQVPAFGAYFFGGCVIGYVQRSSSRLVPLTAGVLAWVAMAALLLMLNPDRAGDELLGRRGVVMFTACFLVVWISGLATVPDRLHGLARWLGDITYGTYLLHPLVFFGFVWFVYPHLTPLPVTHMEAAWRWGMVAAVLAVSCAAATASERWLESPVRRWGKRVMASETVQAPTR